MVIRIADSGDLDTLIDIQEKANLESLSGIFGPEHPLPTRKIALRWRAAFARPGNRVAVCERDGRVVGVTMVSQPWLHALHVLPEHWGRGVGAALHDDALAAIRAAGAQEALLRTFARNIRARRFWEKHGWEKVSGCTLTHQDPPHAELLLYAKLL
jgi:GNAT superfamily N-acetyltransferase